MKQNIEIMNQVYKNFYAIFEDSRRHKNLGNNYISMELLIERESIKFIVGIPEEHFDTIEKAIGGFYPGCITELIDQPKLLEAGKYVEGGEFVLTKPSIFPIRSYESFEADPMDSILSSYSKVLVDEKLCLQILIQPLEETLFKKLREKTDKVKKKKKGIWNLLLSLFKMETKDEKHEEEKNYEFGQNQLGDLDKKLNDEIFSVKIKALATSPDPSRPKKIITDLAKSFFQYTYTGLNGFKFKASKHPMKFARVFVQKLFFSDHHFLRRLFSLNKHMILNIKELSSILHFPHPKFNKNPRIKWQDYKVVPAPDNLPKEGMLIGYNTYGGNRKEVRINFEDRFRHVYIL